MKRILMVGIAGSCNDFLLSLPTIKAYLSQFKEIKDNYEIIIKNYILTTSLKQIADEVVKSKPDIVCFSCYVWNMYRVKFISSLIKAENQDIKIVWGGPDITKSKYDNAEYVGLPVDDTLYGEGENSFYKYLIGKEPPEQKFRDYPSAYLTDSVPQEMFGIEGMRANIETQRGCSFRCSYCQYHKNFKSVQRRKREDVLGEIEYIYKKGIRDIRVVDANFFDHMPFAEDILSGIIDRDIHIKLLFEDNLQGDNIHLAMLCRDFIESNEYNMITIAVGIQSLNEDSLRSVNRIVNIKGYLSSCIDLFTINQVRLRLDIILGLPYETKETYLNSLRFVINKMYKGNHFICPSVLKVLPDTDMVEIAKRCNLVVDKDRQYNVIETPTLPRKGYVECLKLTTLAYKIFGSRDIEKEFRMKDLFFKIQSKLKVQRLSLLIGLTKIVEEHINPESNFRNGEFKDAENYYLRDFHKELSDEKLIEIMKQVGGID